MVHTGQGKVIMFSQGQEKSGNVNYLSERSRNLTVLDKVREFLMFCQMLRDVHGYSNCLEISFVLKLQKSYAKCHFIFVYLK